MAGKPLNSVRRSFIPLGLLALLVFFPLTGCYPRDKEENATVTADLRVWDFGKVKAGAVLKHEFVLKNELPRTLRVKDVTTSCGCTASNAQKKVLAPQETTAIPVTFNSTGYSGSVQQFVYVNTDNVDNPFVKFTIKAEVTQ